MSEPIKKVITQEDIDANPGVDWKVGDEVEFSAEATPEDIAAYEADQAATADATYPGTRPKDRGE